jgi:hypothetical protein
VQMNSRYGQCLWPASVGMVKLSREVTVSFQKAHQSEDLQADKGGRSGRGGKVHQMNR